MKKTQRHAAILDLIQKQSIRTQEEMLDSLQKLGFKTTQATVSRDIKDLKIIKTADGSGLYRYTPSAPAESGDFAAKLHKIFTETVYKTDFAGNIVVLKTYSGMGNAAGAAVDSMKIEGVVGTLAGDDTMLIITRSPAAAEQICAKLANLLEGRE